MARSPGGVNFVVPWSFVPLRRDDSIRLQVIVGWPPASRFDELSSQGIAKALRSGIFASYSIGDLLTRDEDSGLDRYRRYVLQEFKTYAEVRTTYYREEQRWPASEFWRRRHVTVAAPREAPIDPAELEKF